MWAYLNNLDNFLKSGQGLDSVWGQSSVFPGEQNSGTVYVVARWRCLAHLVTCRRVAAVRHRCPLFRGWSSLLSRVDRLCEQSSRTTVDCRHYTRRTTCIAIIRWVWYQHSHHVSRNSNMTDELAKWMLTGDVAGWYQKILRLCVLKKFRCWNVKGS